MNNKTLSIVSYITLIGWLIAFFAGKENSNDLLKYHLRQSLGLILASVALNIITFIVAAAFKINIGYAGLALFVMMILGIINASNEVKKPLPLIGKMFESKFSFIG